MACKHVYYKDYETAFSLTYPIHKHFEGAIFTAKGMVEELHRLYESLKNKATIVLAFRGSSGTILASLVGKDLSEKGYDVEMILSRKDEEASHDFHPISCPENFGRDLKVVVVIDDFIDSGNTIKKIIKDLGEAGYKTLDALVLVNVIDPSTGLCVSKDRRKAITEISNNFTYFICGATRDYYQK